MSDLGNCRSGLHIPGWKRDPIPARIGHRVPISERVKRVDPRKRTSSVETATAQDSTASDSSSPQLNASRLQHTYRMHVSSPSVYSKTFTHKGPGERAPRTVGRYAERQGPPQEKPKVDASRTFVTSNQMFYKPPPGVGADGTGSRSVPVCRPPPSLAQRTDWSVNRVRMQDEATPKSTYETDHCQGTFSTLSSVTQVSSTLDLQAGTTRGTLHMSSFQGHVPASQRNKRRMFDGRDDPRKLQSKDAYYTNLNPNIPGYSGFVPKALVNRRSDPMKVDTRTTKESVHHEKVVDPQITKKHGISSLTAREFFEMPDTSSADGIAAAAKYYTRIRPFEGRMSTTGRE